MQEIEFNDEFDEKIDICINCGSESAVLVGYNAEKDMDKFECTCCDSIY